MSRFRCAARFFLRGAAVGVAAAAFSIAIHGIDPSGASDQAVLVLSPLYVLGFSPDVKTYGELYTIVIAGNAILYGFLGVLISGGWLLAKLLVSNAALRR